MKNVLERTGKSSCRIAALVEEILEYMELYNVQILHIFREDNALNDNLDNEVVDHVNVNCNSFVELNVKGRKILNSDKLQCPHLKVRDAKRWRHGHIGGRCIFLGYLATMFKY